MPEDAAKLAPEHRSCCVAHQASSCCASWCMRGYGPSLGLAFTVIAKAVICLFSYPGRRCRLFLALRSFLLFDRAAGFFRPDRRSLPPTRADAVKAGRASAATVRLGLDSGEHDGMLVEAGRMRAPCWRQLTARS